MAAEVGPRRQGRRGRGGGEGEWGALAAEQALVEARAGVRAELEREGVEEADPHQRKKREDDVHESIIGLCASSLYALLTT